MSEEPDAEGLEAVRYAAGVTDELIVAFLDEVRRDVEEGTPACCDLHGRNCEPPGDLCCWRCTEARHVGWTDERGVSRYGHPRGEECAAPDVSL